MPGPWRSALDRLRGRSRPAPHLPARLTVPRLYELTGDREGAAAETARAGGAHAFGVDSGTGSVGSPRAYEALDATYEESHPDFENPDPLQTALDQTYTWGWANEEIEPHAAPAEPPAAE